MQRTRSASVQLGVNKKLFAELVESMTQMNKIVRGERAPSREFRVDAILVKALRSKIGLSQPKFAALLHVNVGTLRIGSRVFASPPAPLRPFLWQLVGIPHAC
jgi:putative transcriptional regulator